MNAPHRRGFRRLWARLRGGARDPRRAAWAVAIGVFIGCLPLYGLHFWLCLAVCIPFRLDIVLAYLAANISNPLFAPLLIAAEVQVGGLLLTGQFPRFDVARAREVGVGGAFAYAAVGSLFVGGALAAIAGLLTRRLTPEPTATARGLDAAVERTIDRYPRAVDRAYVATKLSTDPVTALLAELGPLGRVVDLGAGRGQFGLLLLELGVIDGLTLTDTDDKKLAAARAAAGTDAVVRQADARQASLRDLDTVLMIDLLHYLPLDDQNALLERAADALPPGGQLVIRDVDGAAPGARLGRWFERLGRWLAINRGPTLAFRPMSEVAAYLRGMGLSVRIGRAGVLLGNQLLVAQRATESRDPS